MERMPVIEQELYFLIAKFLEDGPCKKTVEVFKNELVQHKIVPKRLDWEGCENDQSFEDLVIKYPHISSKHLLHICSRLGPLLDKEFKPCVPGIKSLLGAGRQSLLRTKGIESLRQSMDSESFKNRLVDCVTRSHCCSVSHPLSSNGYNIVQVLFGRQTSGPASRRHLLSPRLFSRTHLLNRTLGHLSAVYCLLFDRTGHYVVTGADDLLVKVWSAVDGRLLHSFRGASAEITDIDISTCNTLLAAGSLDRVIRVWCLQTGVPVASLSGHTGAITGVNFCPNSLNGVQYLVSTSSDGSIAFWSYMDMKDEIPIFPPKPLQYHEKIRPGQAQMLCAKFSSGGMFLAAGSADHHVRVYKMDSDAPHRILEQEKHTDRVDSIQWANRSLRFISGSKDGTAVIWQFVAQRWTTKRLLMTTTLETEGCNHDEDVIKSKLKVTMVCWSSDDALVITAVNDHTMKIWVPSSGSLLKILKLHKDEVYVLESHPIDPRIMLSAGHDGAVHLWDLYNGEILSSYQNHIEGQGNGAVFDAKWSPDGTTIAATDSHGHILLLGLAPLSDKMKMLPKELFFHTDYRPLVRDSENYVLDEQTQLPPHLMPPPFLVDIDGNPYPPSLQRLVPGREFCSTEQLIPNIIFTPGGQLEVIQGVGGETRSNIDQMIMELAAQSGQNGSTRHLPVRPRVAFRQRGELEGVRQSSGNWQREGLDWKQRTLVSPLGRGTFEHLRSRIEFLSQLELEEYVRESHRVIEVVPETTIPLPCSRRQKRRQLHSYRTRATRVQEQNEVDDDEESVGAGAGNNRISTSSSLDSNDLMTSGSSSSSDSSTEYSDWVADHGVNLEPPQRNRRRRVIKKTPSSTVPLSTLKKRLAPQPPRPPPSSSSQPSCSTSFNPPSSSYTSNPPSSDIPESYRPSEWLSEIIPKKFPYYPQMGDEVMFFAQGYDLYVKAVLEKNVYPLSDIQHRPWGNIHLNEPELVKIIGIKYELRPPRLCCLRLAIMKPNGRLTSDRFTIKYHDIPDVIDFFVLKQTYDTAIERKWEIGDRFRSMIDDGWWWGTIMGKNRSNSSFLCHSIKWDNGESEAMSPWDMEPVDSDREPEYGGSVPVLPEEISAILYHPRGDEWPGGDRETACRRVLAGLEEIMGLSAAEPFLAPVDITLYPEYVYIVEFPIDLLTIKARFENRFYRRVTAAQFDIRYLATNAEKFNEPHSDIVKKARIVTDLCLRICKDHNPVDVPLLYRQSLEAYESSDTQSGSDPVVPSTSTRERAAASRSLRAMRRANHNQPDWRRDCKQLLDVLFNCQDSEPFRDPVDRLEHTDYDKVIDTPMDLGTVREELMGGNYPTPMEFCKDVRTIFTNSRSYNTNKRSKIYVMTVRLSAMAEEHMKRIILNWRRSCRHQSKLKKNARRKKRVVKKKTSDSDETDEEDSDYRVPKSKPRPQRRRVLGDVSSKNFLGEPSGLVTNGYAKSSDKHHKRSNSGYSSESNTRDKEITLEGKKVTANKETGRSLRSTNQVSYKETGSDSSSSSSSSSSEGDVFKHWSMNGQVKVLRPVRRVTPTTSSVGDQPADVAKEKRDNAATPSSSSSSSSSSNSSSNSSSSSSSSSSSTSDSADSTGSSNLVVSKKSTPVISALPQSKSSSRPVKRKLSSDGDYSPSGDTPLSSFTQRNDDGRPRRSVKRTSYVMKDDGDDEFIEEFNDDEDYSGDDSEVEVKPAKRVRQVRNNHDKSGRKTRGRRTVYNDNSSLSSDEAVDSDSDSMAPLRRLSVSSRGRVRKLTARARAYLKD